MRQQLQESQTQAMALRTRYGSDSRSIGAVQAPTGALAFQVPLFGADHLQGEAVSLKD